MEQLTHVLKTNQHYLKACILYEVLQKKPVFDSYLSFCKTIGDNVMDYVDYEYWFYRFYNGNCDFDHDRSQEPKQETLLELPVDILRMITGKVEPMQRVFFSMVCKTIKHFCNMHHPRYEKVEVSMFGQALHLNFDRMEMKYSNSYEVSNKLKINDGPEKDITEHFWAAGRKTVTRALNIPNLQIEHLTFEDDRHCSAFSSAFPLDLNVKSVEVRTCRPNAIITTMAFLQTKTLQKIKLFSYVTANLDLFMESRHFAEAKEVNVTGFGSVTTMEKLKKFSHLEKFGVTFYNITPEIVTGIQDMLSTFKTFKSCSIASHANNVSALGQALGANVREDVESVIHRTKIQGTRDFLEFKIDRSGILVEKVRFIF